MNPKRPESKHIRVSTELFDWLAKLAASYGVSKRDAVDALLADFKGVCDRAKERGNRSMADRVFTRWVDRYNIKRRLSKANKTGRRRLGAEPESPAATPDVPDFMK